MSRGRKRQGGNSPKLAVAPATSGDRRRVATGPKVMGTLQGIPNYVAPGSVPFTLYEGASGRRYAADLYSDRFATAREVVIQPVYAIVSTPANGPFQTGSGANPRPNVTALQSSFLANIFNAVMRAYQAKFQRAIPTSNLTTPAASIVNWLCQVAIAWGNLRTLETILRVGGVNSQLEIILGGLNANVSRIEANISRLLTFGIPQGLCDALDLLFGVKALDERSIMVTPFINIGTAGLDISTAVNVQTVLSLVDGATGAFNILESTADLQFLNMVFSECYGFPTWHPGAVSYDPGQFWVHLAQATTYKDTTAAKLFTEPNINDFTASVVPILMPKGTSPEMARLMLSLYRPPVYGSDPVAGTASAGVASVVGYFSEGSTQSSAGNSAVGLWQEGNAAFTSGGWTGAGTAAGTESATGFANFVTAPWSGLEVSPAPAQDHRNFWSFDWIYVTEDQLIAETETLYDSWFLDPLR